MIIETIKKLHLEKSLIYFFIPEIVLILVVIYFWGFEFINTFKKEKLNFLSLIFLLMIIIFYYFFIILMYLNIKMLLMMLFSKIFNYINKKT